MAAQKNLRIEVIADIKQAIKSLQKLQKGTDELSDETVENFTRMRKAMDEMNEKASTSGNAMTGMASQFSYALSDLPMMFVDVRMGMMGIMNNIQPMMMQMSQMSKKGTSMGSIFSKLGSTLMGPAGITAAIMAVVMLGPDLIDFFSDSKEAAEEAKKAVEDLNEVTNITSIENLKKKQEELEATNQSYQIQIDKLSKIQSNLKDLDSFSGKKKSEVLFKFGRAEQDPSELYTDEEIIQLAEAYEGIEKIADILNISLNEETDYKEAVEAVDKALEEREKDLKSNNRQLAMSQWHMKNLIELEQKSNEEKKKLSDPITIPLEVEGQDESFTIPPELQKEMQEFDQWYRKNIEDRNPFQDFFIWQDVGEYTTLDRLKDIRQEMPKLYNGFRMFGSTAEQALLNTDNAGQALLRTLKSLLAKAGAMTAFFTALKLFAPGSNAVKGLGLGEFLLEGLFGGSFASGGRPDPNTVNLVGENGPELFIPDGFGTIYNNKQVQEAVKSMANTERPINIVFEGKWENKLKGKDLHQVVKIAKQESY